MTDKKTPSTRSLIADAEALRADKGGKKTPKTKQLVAESEKLIGRESAAGSGKGVVMAVVFVLLLLGVALLIWQMLPD